MDSFSTRHRSSLALGLVFFAALVIAHFAQPESAKGYDPMLGPQGQTEVLELDQPIEVVIPTVTVRPSSTKTAYEEVAVENGGVVRGAVRFATKPARWTVEYNKDEVKCGHRAGHLEPTERVVFDDTTLGVGNCFVALVDIARGKAWTGPMATEERSAVIDQQKCKYVPHVLVVRTDTQVELWNSDPAEHNFHIYKGPTSASGNQLNELSPAGGKKTEVGNAFFQRAGAFYVKCDIHSWMSGYIHVVAHPYWVLTGKDGTFEIADVPPGTYTLVVWHEGMSEQPVFGAAGITSYDYGRPVEIGRKVEIKAGETLEADFEIPAPKAPKR